MTSFRPTEPQDRLGEPDEEAPAASPTPSVPGDLPGPGNATNPTVSSRRVTGDVVIQIISLTANVAIGVVVTAILARKLGAVGFGEWSTIFAVVGITGYLADLKMQEVAIREITAQPEAESVWLGALVSIQAVIVVPVAVVTAIVLLVVSESTEMRIAAVIISGSVIATVFSVMTIVFRLRVRNDLSMAVLTFNSVAWAGAVIAVAAAGGGLVPFALAFTLCTFASATLTMALARRRAHFQFRGSSRDRWTLLARAGFVLGLAGLLSLGHSQIDQLLVYELAPHKVDAGLYAGLNRVLVRAMTVPNALMTTLFPLIAAAVAENMTRAKHLVQITLEYLAMISLPAFGFILVAAEPVLRLLYGPDFVSAAGTFPVVMASFVVSCWGYVSANMVIILGLQRKFIVYVTVGLLLNIGINLLVIPKYGYKGAAWVTVFTESVVIGLSLWATLHEMHMRIQVLRLIRIALVSAAMTLVLYGVKALNAGLVALIVVAVIVYPLLLVLTGTLDRKELRTLIARRSG